MPKNRKKSDNKIIKGTMVAGAAMAGFLPLSDERYIAA